jgi:hypothetical protein
MQHDIDDNFYTTRTIRGHAVFRTDLLLDRGEVPDDFRQRLFHSVPPNFKRDKVSVEITEDGTRCNYTVVDRQETVNIDPALGITRVEASMAVELLDPAIVGFASKMVKLRLRVWGGRMTKRLGLLHALGNCARAYNLKPFDTFGQNTRVWVNMVEKEASMEIDLLANNPVAALFVFGGANLFGGGKFTAFPEDLLTIAPFNNGTSNYPGVGSTSPGSRGSYIGRMVHQALSAPAFSVPPKPPAAEANAINLDF